MYKYPHIPHIIYPSQNKLQKYLIKKKNTKIKMPKIHPKDKLLYANTVRRALIQGRPILEEFTEDKDLAKVIQKNLEYSYK